MPRGGAKSAEHIGKLIAGSKRYHRRKRLRAAELSSGLTLGGGLNQDFRPQRAHVDTTPAVWRSVYADIGDSEYVDDSLDEVLLRALHDRVVYAQSVCCHHEPCFQDVTIAAIAAADKEFRKNGKRQPRGLLKGTHVKKAKKVAAPKTTLLTDLVKIAKKTGHREGRSLIDVVDTMFKDAA